ncbi:MAG: zinc-binding dehydrogenase [Streptosporangiales bacterium]|nr:zinc-binding dehydrogenase [Streptosporangiales bacterium]
MLAVRFHEYGDAGRLVADDVPVPEPGPEEVLVAVRACGVNHVDILSREGKTPAPVELPHVSGTEVAGEVAAVGSAVREWTPGDRVLVNPALSCGSCTPCREGRDNMCRHGLIYGVQTQGGYAEHAVAPGSQLLPIPRDMPYGSAAAVAVTGSTAWHMLVTRGRVSPDENVLVVAAGSGIGVLGVQIAKLAGARVIATAGSEEKLAMAERLGADFTVNHGDPDWPGQVRGYTGGRGVDLVFEHVGQATWEGSLQTLTRGGRLVTCGGHSGFDVSVNLWHLFAKEHTLIGSFAGTRRDLEHVLGLSAAGRVRPVIHAEYPLERAAEAQTELERRGVFGKVLLHP